MELIIMKVVKNGKYLSVFFIIALISVMLIFVSCENNNIDYKSLEGYKEYISDSDKGYEDLPYFNVVDSMEESEKAREYFRANSRQCGPYIITDYEDGVCINEYLGSSDSFVDVLSIPETLDGKPVVKIGGFLQQMYIDEIDEIDEIVIGAFGGYFIRNLQLPSTLKIITRDVLKCSPYTGFCENGVHESILRILVNKNNPYYTSKDGVLYSKDLAKLVYIDYYNDMINVSYEPLECFSYIVPDFVESFEPTKGVPSGLNGIKIGKNVKNINTYINRDEDGLDWALDIIVSGYKNTAAEEWAKQENIKFEALD